MTDRDLAEIIELGHETQRVEFKGPGRRDDGHTMAVVTRAVLAMTNLRGGGVVVIGVAERADKSLEAVGVSLDIEATWTNFDAVCDQFGRYADPSVVFEIEVREYSGKRFVVINVQEFAEVPILCRQNYQSAADPARGRPAQVEVLRGGACYVRSKRKPESAVVRTSEDMRDLIGLAVEKAIARQATLDRIRLAAAAAPDPRAHYDAEQERM